MMPAWIANLPTLGQEAQAACDLRFDLDEDHWLSIWEYGTWWVLPIARTFTDHIVGLRLTPNLPLHESPVVELFGHEALTVASRPAYLVPAMILRGALAGVDIWKAQADRSEEVWGDLEAMHGALGGDDGLSRVRALLGDKALREAACGIDTFRSVAGDLFSRADRAPETVAFRAYVQQATETHAAALPLPDVGCWRAAAASVALLSNGMAEWKGSRLDDQLAAAWEVCLQPPGLDSFQVGSPSHLIGPTSQSHETVANAARLLVANAARLPAGWISDSRWEATRALAESTRYNGGPHMDAAGLLAAAGRSEQALTCLISSAYWMRVATSEPFEPLFQAARILAHESQWTEIADALDWSAEMVIQAGAAD